MKWKKKIELGGGKQYEKHGKEAEIKFLKSRIFCKNAFSAHKKGTGDFDFGVKIVTSDP